MSAALRADDPVLYAGVHHAPPGGVTIGGKFFAGGEFVPGDVVASATPEERAKLVERPARQIGHVGEHEDDAAQDRAAAEKPYKTGVADQLAKVFGSFARALSGGKKAEEHATAHAAWTARRDELWERRAAALEDHAGNAAAELDDPEKLLPDVADVLADEDWNAGVDAYSGQYEANWDEAFGAEGGLLKALTGAGADDRERAAVVSLAARGKKAVSKAAGEYRGAATRYEEVARQRKALEDSLDEPEEPGEDATPEQQAAYQAATKAWDEGNEKLGELEGQEGALADEVGEAAQALSDTFEAHQQHVADAVEKVTSRLEGEFDAAEEADPEPEEPEADEDALRERAGAAVEKAIRGRAALQLKQIEAKEGPGFRRLRSYADLVRTVNDTAEKASGLLDEAASAEFPALAQGMARAVGVRLATGLASLRDEIEASKQADRKRHLTGPLSAADEEVFGPDDMERSEPWSVAGEAAWRDSLPPQLAELDPSGKSPAVALSPRDRRAVRLYTGGAYERLNRDLRETHEGAEADWSPKTRKLHQQLQEVFSRLQPAETPAVVYRGLQLGHQQTVSLLARIRDAHANGYPVQLAGYSSTTFDPAIAFEYAEGGKRPRAGGRGNDVVFEIAARKGLSVGGLAADSPTEHVSESELLLDHNSTFHVKAIREIPFKDPVTQQLVKRVVIQMVQEV